MQLNHNVPPAGNENLTGSQSQSTTQSGGFLQARQVRERYNVSDMTIWRWLRDLDFPQPVYISRYRYWRVSDIEAWEARQASKGAA
ncbi:MAG: AlpA family phage regulatory protein [Mesorhizobium sp.]|uniref:helix-turn-helix transcriptional regulator n=1 Tax=Mesorhizobium sp. TaxID=1871066 RepID=UPI000FE5575A|nr:AlpA family phage regulatory protein [Mesorhizobium sp.]RWD50873.1 MAG: AlpA family phage regulatory protein [Mesorhizobium sp.]RWE58564.1 MAG: AlpA family phage regulatory protein [Mesorhizobium sp.]RWF09184.1 MAG: AlpA family phage regulatory protein [Mesorhizobium sp.]RWF21401.1 MAG: AlpA family phage regulatory protein [Mesorhizobium sp.]TIW47961.1 MAG: AlpA family phage regulatory protein [Mesorhizobium sp.]